MIYTISTVNGSPVCSKLADVESEWFFSEDPVEMELARSVCSHCPIKRECLEWANSIETNERYRWGIYGGLTSIERKALA